MPVSDQTFRGTSVAFNDRALLIMGASGTGKSSLALQMMSMGCLLVSDDYTVLTRNKDTLVANAPTSIQGMIEARGVGILQADNTKDVNVVGIVDLDITETERLPPKRNRRIKGVQLRLFHNVTAPYFPAALLQYLKSYCDSQDQI